MFCVYGNVNREVPPWTMNVIQVFFCCCQKKKILCPVIVKRDWLQSLLSWTRSATFLNVECHRPSSLSWKNIKEENEFFVSRDGDRWSAKDLYPLGSRKLFVPSLFSLSSTIHRLSGTFHSFYLLALINGWWCVHDTFYSKKKCNRSAEDEAGLSDVGKRNHFSHFCPVCTHNALPSTK